MAADPSTSGLAPLAVAPYSAHSSPPKPRRILAVSAASRASPSGSRAMDRWTGPSRPPGLGGVPWRLPNRWPMPGRGDLQRLPPRLRRRRPRTGRHSQGAPRGLVPGGRLARRGGVPHAGGRAIGASMTNPPTECPRCHGHSFRTADSRLNRDGRRRRRYRCHSCDYRWTVWEDERSQSPPKKRQRRPLNPDEVRLILLSPLSSCSLARQLGCSHEAVCSVRRGDTHAGLWPEIPRQRARTGPSCVDRLQPLAWWIKSLQGRGAGGESQ